MMIVLEKALISQKAPLLRGSFCFFDDAIVSALFTQINQNNQQNNQNNNQQIQVGSPPL